jgi:hypothetical protein
LWDVIYSQMLQLLSTLGETSHTHRPVNGLETLSRMDRFAHVFIRYNKLMSILIQLDYPPCDQKQDFN